MTAFLLGKLTLATVATAMALVACGGGGGDTAVAAAPAAPEVFVTMVRSVIYGETDRNNVRVFDNDATTLIAAVTNAGIRARAVRCAGLSGVPNRITTASVHPVLFMDVSTEDVEKLKAFKFLVFSTVEQPSNIFEQSCVYVSSPAYL